MSILACNCHGIGTTSTVRKLEEIIREQCPVLVFLVEMKCGHRQFEVAKQQLGLFGVCVSTVRRSRGIALLWQQYLTLHLRSFSRFHIDMDVLPSDSIAEWRVTGFYGATATQ
ncbi:UNVERIFIED_CONTAM: hypothetical protein Sradi_6564300 [Sesamum radiatum]|uniref:Uncharacterized protein n=1 Tax=Sesamum radiatum TaxID=300843 RepID=A0AAW2JWK6_SESRA